MTKPVLRCAFGSPWGRRGCGPCRKCLAEADRLERAFWQGVFFGAWNDRGYTPAEWAAKAKRVTNDPTLGI